MSTKQINVRFEGPALEQLESLVRATGKSLSDVLREAVNTSHWLQQQQAEGNNILLQEKNSDNPVRVVFR